MATRCQPTRASSQDPGEPARSSRQTNTDVSTEQCEHTVYKDALRLIPFHLMLGRSRLGFSVRGVLDPQNVLCEQRLQ